MGAMRAIAVHRWCRVGKATRAVSVVLGASILFGIFSAHSQDGGLEIKPQFQDAIRRKIEGFGLNCPIPYRLTQVTEDARGIIGRLDCLNSDGKTWSLRYIIGINREFMEPW
jgi:hypothetical protein